MCYHLGVDCKVLDEAIAELNAIPAATERTAILNAVDKLRVVGIALGHPHTSQVAGSEVRELRPRQGRSPWRAFYGRVGNVLIVLAIGPEAAQNPRGFRRAVGEAEQRLARLRPRA